MTETTKIGRNDPCRCGSGTKYKRCCLPADDAPAIARAREVAVQEAVFARGSAEISAMLRRRGLPRNEDTLRSIAVEMEHKANEIARLCTLAVNLIAAGQFDEASDVCDRLEREYPEEVDGLELRARLHEARGDTAVAAQTYRRALDFTRGRVHFDLDEELRNSYRGHIARLEALVANADPND